MLPDPVGKEDGELQKNLPPVLDAACPLTCDVHGDQVEHFEQCFVDWEDALSLCYFAKLTVVALNHVGRIDEFTQFRRILKEGRKLLPVAAPRADILSAKQ